MHLYSFFIIYIFLYLGMVETPAIHLPANCLSEEFTEAVRKIKIFCLELKYDIPNQVAYICIMELGSAAFNNGSIFIVEKAKEIQQRLKQIRSEDEQRRN